MKNCTKCKKEKNKNELNKHKYTKDKLRPDCKVCQALYFNKYYTKNTEKISTNSEKFYLAHKKELIAYQQKYRLENKEKISKQKAEYAVRKKAEIAARKARHLKANPERYRDWSAKRRAKKLKATPKWANLEEIKKNYLNCPKDYEVDHIIPLQGKIVCGLHVENNLQYLTKVENRKKGNKY